MYKYMELKKEIVSEIKEMKPHQRIMSRPSMCTKYNVSRATVNKVMQELLKEGLIYTNKGSGTFISQKKDINVCYAEGGIETWGVILPNVMYDIYPGLLRGIEDFAQQHNINTVICNTDHDVQKEYEYIMRLVCSGVSGIIIVPAISKTDDLRGFKYMIEKGIPFVFCNRGIDSLSNIPLVCSNDFYGGYIATKHLLENGYRRIAFISHLRYRSSMDRHFGYSAALMEAGIEIDRSIIATEILDTGNDGVYECALNMLSLPNPPDAFFCHNDMIASGVYKAALEKKLIISDDIGLIGYDNSVLCEMMETRLTSVSFKNYETGNKAGEILYNLISGQKFEGSNVSIFQPEIIKRDSCKGPVKK